MSATMRAAVLHGKEDVRLEDHEVPEPGRGEIVLRNEAALTCGTDVKVFRRGYHARMLTPPTVFGHEVAGTVAAVGEGVTGLAVGARVVVANSAPCGSCPFCLEDRENLCDDLLFWNGAYAQFSRIPARIAAKNTIHVAPGVTFRQAAMVEPLACVVRGAAESGIADGHHVAVIGTGSIGLMFVALARLRGARVVSVGRNPNRLKKAAELGAEGILDAGDGDELGLRLREESPGGRGFDVVVEAAGQVETAEAAFEAVAKGGLVNLFAGSARGTHVSFDVSRAHYDGLRVVASFHHTPAAIREAHRLVAEGSVDPDRFITSEASLEDLPTVLRALAHGGDGLKTA
ncbi:MAG TPA: alcohol dehydrogenase catalytic domain-containing protein, partial [Vicinamibacteria bacterium]|nr:alcohol dehydrogenase catalytic domain-containing protein [Vicinamibacteria bacterium]